ncbi:hypothetical protein BDK51DRAFT_40163 [Blyttiomyces helicus]|uniref:Uncharacterized protein n=1 Tax=Blyttiomyces helicus TaxID=388810 RepID=A0A4V1IQ29_9FUNG|nr:hypothetical protein BDK51DRAFT_40163 [Blyttiomyces helicus]|eukprot:RKO85117.1 hypothetical protein BDK51DRAFT_40163 [Blyttiomyces helicus]
MPVIFRLTLLPLLRWAPPSSRHAPARRESRRLPKGSPVEAQDGAEGLTSSFCDRQGEGESGAECLRVLLTSQSPSTSTIQNPSPNGHPRTSEPVGLIIYTPRSTDDGRRDVGSGAAIFSKIKSGPAVQKSVAAFLPIPRMAIHHNFGNNAKKGRARDSVISSERLTSRQAAIWSAGSIVPHFRGHFLGAKRPMEWCPSAAKSFEAISTDQRIPNFEDKLA